MTEIQNELVTDEKRFSYSVDVLTEDPEQRVELERLGEFLRATIVKEKALVENLPCTAVVLQHLRAEFSRFIINAENALACDHSVGFIQIAQRPLSIASLAVAISDAVETLTTAALDVTNNAIERQVSFAILTICEPIKLMLLGFDVHDLSPSDNKALLPMAIDVKQALMGIELKRSLSES